MFWHQPALADPFWSHSTNMVQTLCNLSIVCCALALLLMDSAQVLDINQKDLEEWMSTVLIIINGMAILVSVHPFFEMGSVGE